MTIPVTVFTGTRAEYGLLRPLIRRLARASIFEPTILATAMHCSPIFGSTLKEIEADALAPIVSIDMLLSSGGPVSVAKSVALGIAGYADYLDQRKPKLCILLGDRTETLGFASACYFFSIPIAHIHGGDLSLVDDSARHAITKLSHHHFAATALSAGRILQMGERPEHVHTVGAIGLDEIVNRNRRSLDELSSDLPFPLRSPYAVSVVHPIPQRPEESSRFAQAYVKALHALHLELKLHFYLFYPNSDVGYSAWLDAVNSVSRSDWATAISSLPRDLYLDLVGHSKFLIGNSSSGIIESAALKVGCINVGDRQRGRERTENVVECSHLERIPNAARLILEDPQFRDRLDAPSPYGNGTASAMITEILERKAAQNALIYEKAFVQRAFVTQ